MANVKVTGLTEAGVGNYGNYAMATASYMGA